MDAILVFLVMLPACLVGTRLGAPPSLIYLFLQIDQVIKCGVALVKVNRFHWAHDLTETTSTLRRPPIPSQKRSD